MDLKKIKITPKQLIVANIFQFVVSIAFMRFSEIFRLNKDLHWIYTFGHCWYLMASLPCFFWGSLLLGGYTLLKIKTNKILYLFFTLFPLLFFLIITFFVT